MGSQKGVFMSNKNTQEHEKHLDASRNFWDKEAITFDNEPDHGLHDPVVRAEWTNLLRKSLPFVQSKVLDIGCGTGSLSMILAQLGYQVTGIDLSPVMIAKAREKVEMTDWAITFQIMDATFPELPPQQFDIIVCRHLLWTLPEPAQVLQRWINLLRPQGYLVLIEGFWSTGAGLHADDIVEAIPSSMVDIKVEDLSNQVDLWGGEVTDERYIITTKLKT